MGKGKIAIIMVVVAIAAILILPTFIGSFMNDGFNANMGVTFYDEDGNPIPQQYAFVNVGGAVVDRFVTKVTWTLVSASGATVGTPAVSGSVVIVVSSNAVILKTVSHTIDVIWDDAALAGEKSFTNYLSILIGTPTEEGKTYGWQVTITGNLNAAGMVDGDVLNTDWDGEITFTVTWQTDALVLEGAVIYS